MTHPMDFHHIGVACAAIEVEAQTWSLLGYQPEGEPFVDEAQGIRGQFMVGPGPRMELLEPTDGSTTLDPWLRRRIKLYHCGYLVPDFDAAAQWLQQAGATVARDAMRSVYFNSRIMFLMMPNMALVEIIEKTNSQSLPAS
jgi:methylmalonyl-CoA/ethylmalonyl-CoA epimerase